MNISLYLGAALAVAGLVIWGLWSRLDSVQLKLDAANVVIEQAEKDRQANAKAVQQLAAKLQSTETRTNTIIREVYAAPQTNNCAGSPAMRAATDGVRNLIQGSQANDRRQPAATLSGPNAGTGGRQ